MQVSIIIVNYNTFGLTCNCIRSIKAITGLLEYEIILVDNASKDVAPAEFLREFPDLVLVESETNVGFAAGNNLGIERAKGEYILLLNSDTVLKNDAITICRDFLIKNAGVGAVTARLEYPDGAIQHNCQRFPSIFYSLFELFRLQMMMPRAWGGKILFGFFFLYNEVAFPDWIWGTFFMFKKNILNRLPRHKLPDNFFMYVEDMQWCMELHKLGYRVAFVPEAHVIHYMGQSGAKKNNLMNQNTTVFMQQYYSSFKVKIINFLNRLLVKQL